MQLVIFVNEKKAQSKLLASQKEAKDLSIQLGNQQKSEKELVRTHGQIKAELTKTKTSLQFYKTQFEHESRKFVKEKEKFKERLSKVIQDRLRAVQSTISVSATLPPKLEVVQEQKDEMYDIVISNYEVREKELLQENLYLRQLLYDFYRYLESKTFNELEHLGEAIPEELVSHESIHEAIFQLPLEMMRETVLASIERSLDHLVQVFKLSGEHDQNNVDLLEKLQEKEVELVEMKQLLDKKIEYTNESMAEKMNEQVKQKYQELELKQKQLEEDRKRFADAAIKMGLERAALQREKAELQDQLAEKVLNTSSFPSTPTWLKQGSTPQITKSLEQLNMTPNDATPVPEKKHDDQWLESETPDLDGMQDESVLFQDENVNPFDSPLKNMTSEILVESKTLSFSPTEIKKSALKNSALKAGKSVRIHSPSLKQTASELLRRQTPRRPFSNLTSTPL